MAVLSGGGSAAVIPAPDSVAAIAPSSGRIHQASAVGGSPSGVAAGLNALWVANTDDGTVSRFDPRTFAVQQTIAANA